MAQLFGELSLMSAADLVVWCAHRRASGILSFERGPIEKCFVLHDGQIIRATSSDPREHFGQFLIHHGLMTEDQLERAFATQRDTKVLLGRILTMIGIVSEDQVTRILANKISESLIDTFRWRDGRFHLTDNIAEEERPAIEVEVPLLDVHREGLKRSALWAEFSVKFPNRQHILTLDETKIPATIVPETLEGRILKLANQRLSLEAVALELHATDYQIAHIVLRLVACGAIIVQDPQDNGRNTLSIPDLGRDRAELIRHALANKHYTEAFSHVHSGLREAPHDPTLRELAKDTMSRFTASFSATTDWRQVVPQHATQLDEFVQRRLSPKQLYLLRRIDGQRTLNAIIQVSPMEDHEALGILSQLIDGDLIRFQ